MFGIEKWIWKYNRVKVYTEFYTAQHSAVSVIIQKSQLHWRKRSLFRSPSQIEFNFSVSTLSHSNAHVVINETKEFLWVSLRHGHAMQFLFTVWKMTVLAILALGKLLRQPVKAFIQSIALCGTGGLNVPLKKIKTKGFIYELQKY